MVPRGTMLDTTDHQAAYRRAFGQSVRVDPATLPSRLVAVLFTNRCGSMLFTEMIGSSPDIMTYYEVFNGAVVRDRSGGWAVDTFADYLARIFGRPHVTYTAKVHAVQLGFLSEAGLLQAFAGGVTFYRVRRRDQIAQAVSHSIARQTGRWTSFVGGEGDEPRYDFAEIDAILGAIRREQDHLDAMTGQLGITVQDVVHEDFLQAPQAVLDPAWTALDVRPGFSDPARARHRRQATDLNRDFIHQFRSDLARRGRASAA